MIFGLLSHFSPHTSRSRRALISVLCLLTSVLLLPSARAYEWQNSGIWESALAERAFDSGPSWFSAGPRWLMNAMPGSHVSRARAQYLLDRASDREESTPEYNGYVGTLHDVFDVSLFSNIATFAHSMGGKLPATILAPLNSANSFTGGTTGSLLVNGNWSLGHVPIVSEDAVFDSGSGGTGIRKLTAGNLTVGSFNVAVTTGTYSIRNDTSTATDSTLTLGGSGSTGNNVSGTSADLLFANTGSTFNIIGPNGSTGSGVLNVVLGQGGNFNAAGTITVSSVISDGGSGFGITKTGAGTLTLSGANLFTGGVTINAGTLIAGNATALGPATNATLTFGSGSTGKLQLNGNNITIIDLNTNATVGTPVIESGSGTAGTDTLTVNTANSDTYGGVLQNGSTRLLALTKSGAGTLTLSGTNTYSGGTIMSNGTLQLGISSTGSVTNGPVGTGTLTLNGGTLSSDSTTARSISNAITLGGDVILGSSTNFGTLTLSGAGTLTGSRTLTLNSDVTYSGNIGESGGSFGLTKAGGGTLILSGVNAYSGGTTVSAGLLQLNSSSALGSSSGSLTVNGGIVDLNGQNISVGNFTGSGGTIWNNGPNAGSSTVTLTTGTNNTGGGTYAGVITDNNGAAPSAKVALTKTGNGTITLSGANTYTGATTVNGGTLLINGSTAAGSAVTVNNSGTLGGTGTVSGTVQVNSGGTLSPGTSPGTLHTGALTLANGSTFAVDLTAVSGNDLLVAPSVTLGTLVTGPSLSLNITGTLSTGQQFFIVNNTGANAVQGVFAQGATITSGQYTFLIDYLANFDTSSAVGGNDIMLEVTAIPEASTWIGAALALGAIALMSRKRFTKHFRVIG
jgi:fibronectin-binding autotransporter adhesin